MGTRSSDIEAIQALVSAKLAPKVVEWLDSGVPPHVFGLPLLGVPIGPIPDNCWGATILLRTLRPKLTEQYLVVRLLDNRALCIRPLDGKHRGTPMYEVDLDGDDEPIECEQTFEEYLAQGEEDRVRSEKVIDEMARILAKQKYTYDHSKGQLPRAHETRLVRSCVHDVVVGLASMRQDDQLDNTSIGVFETTDHPLYESGHGVRSLAALVLADAYKSGVSMALQFEAVEGLRARVAPREFVELAAEVGVQLVNASSGAISHDEGAALFARLSGLLEGDILLIERAAQFERVTVEAVSYLIISRCWNLEEVQWVLRASPRPIAVLFGDDGPEDWLKLSESALFGRAAILATMFRASLNEDGEEGVETTRCWVKADVIFLDVLRPVRASWADRRLISKGTQIAVLPRPRSPVGFETSLIQADAAKLALAAGESDQRVLLYSSEARAVDMRPLAEDLSSLAVSHVLSSYSISDLQQLYETRLRRARRVRR